MNLSRQSLLLSSEALETSIGVVGLGSIGSPVIFTLAKMGFENIQAWEPDTLEEANIGGGLFDSRKVGKPKTEAVASITLIASGQKLTNLQPVAFTPETPALDVDVLILAVDSFELRAMIFDTLVKNESRVRYIIDGRIGGHVYNVFTMDVTDESHIKSWRDGLNRDDPPLPCGMKSTAYVTFACAAGICASVAAIANGVAPYKCQILDFEDRQAIFQ